MAETIDARVKQKTGVAADFAGYTLLEGEIALVRTSAGGPVWNFKVGPGVFDSLDWSLQNPGAAQKADTSTVFPVGVPGLYIPTEDGTYEGVTVDLSSGYTQLIWDGATLIDAVFPIDLSSYAKRSDLDQTNQSINNLMSLTDGAENLFISTDFVENYRYNNPDGVLTPDAGFAALLLSVEMGETYTIIGNGPYLNYVRFNAAMERTASTVPAANPDGSFTLLASVAHDTHYLGITLMNDGQFNRKPSIIINQGELKPLTLDFEKINNHEDIVLKSYLFKESANLINKDEIVFGANVGSGGVISSDQMYIKLEPVPAPGVYAVSGIINFSVRGQVGATYPSIVRNIVDDYFTFEVPTGLDALYLNLAASSADWWRADTVMMNPGATPLPYEPYGTHINPEFIPPTDDTGGSGIEVVPFNLLPHHPEDGKTVYIPERYAAFVASGGDWQPLSGNRLYEKPRGLVYAWTFNGGSLAADGVTKSTGLSVDSESYSTGNGYTIDAPAQTNLYEYLRMNDAGIRLLEFQRDILELTINRTGGNIGLLYIGQTVSRKVQALAGIAGNLIYMRAATNEPPTSYSYNATLARTLSVGRKYRIVHDFFGSGRRVSVYDITDGDPVEIGMLSLIWPMTGSGAYSERPNNRAVGISINNFGATISRFEVQTMEPERAELVLMGDSISVSRTATAYENGWAKLVTDMFGAGAILHGGGSNTAEDLLASIDDTLVQKPKRVVLAIGTNDCNLNKPNRYAEHQSIVTQLESAGAEVIISNVIPAYSQAENAANWTRVLDYNAWLQTTYGDTHTIVDQFSALVNGAGNGWNLDYKADDLHPNDAGHRVMFDNLKQFL